MASLCAPATTAQISTGLAMVSSAARACRRRSPWASTTTPAQAMMNGTTAKTCSQKTMSCMFSPPSWLASSCDQEVIGPYTLGVSCQGRSVQRSTGSNWPRNTSAGVISYGSAADAPATARTRRTSARRPRSAAGTLMVARLSPVPSANSRLTGLPAVGEGPHGRSTARPRRR